MRVTYDPEKRESTFRERGLDFEDAVIVFQGSTVGTRAKTTVKSESSVTACLPDAWWWLATHRVARFVTSSA
jgi:uncharacterized DUF497 family protein